MSNKPIIITIGREYGSGGHEIGEKVAKKLGISFYDKNLIEIAAKTSGLDIDVASACDETAPGLMINPYAPSISDKLYLAQCEEIRRLSKTDSFVIVGRCANAVLQDYADSFNIFVYAPLEKRIHRVMDRFLISAPDKAKKEILRTDKVRRTYYQYYTEFRWCSPEGHHMMIDSSLLGIEGTVDTIVEMALKHFNDEP